MLQFGCLVVLWSVVSACKLTRPRSHGVTVAANISYHVMVASLHGCVTCVAGFKVEYCYYLGIVSDPNHFREYRNIIIQQDLKHFDKVALLKRIKVTRAT